MNNVIPLKAGQPVSATTRLECSKCGASTDAACNCGVPYVPKKERAAAALAASPDKSNRQIASETGVHHSTVSRARPDDPGPGANAPGPRSSHEPKFEPRNSFYKLPRGKEINAVYLGESAHAKIGKAVHARGGRELWQMILDAVDAGFSTPNRNATTKSLTLRVLFTSWPPEKLPGKFVNRYNLADPRHRRFVRDVIWPIALANRDAVLADPTCLERLVMNRDRQEQTTPQVTPQPKVPALPPNEYPCTMYGLNIWPRPVTASYDYRQARAATWLFHDLMNMMVNSPVYTTPKGRARAIRFALRTLAYCGDQSTKDIVTLTTAIATAMEAHPDAPCDPMPKPTDNVW